MTAVWRWAFRLRWALCLMAAGTILYLARGYCLSAVAGFLNIGAIPQSVDYVLVLGGGGSTRPFVAAALVKAGLAERVLLCRDKLTPMALDGVLPPEHEIDRQVLLMRGVPADRIILLDGEAGSTFDEAQALGRFLSTQPGRSVAVITNTFHTRRARWVIREVLGESAAGIRFVAAPTDGFNESNWWRYEEGVGTYVMEYVKLPYYWVRYGLRWYYLLVPFFVVAFFLLARRELARRRTMAACSHPVEAVV